MFSLSKTCLGLSLLLSLPLFAAPVQELKSDTYAEAFKKTDKPLIVGVFAQWCGPCKVMKPIFKDTFAEQNPQYVCATVDFDESSTLAQSWGVKGLPTILVVMNGKIVGKSEGQVTAEQLKAKIEQIVTQAGKSLHELTGEEKSAKLQDAIQDCSLEDVKQLIGAGVDVNALLPNGMLPIFFGISHCTFKDQALKMVELLVDKGAKTKDIQVKGVAQPVVVKDVVTSSRDQFQKMVDVYTSILSILDKAAV